jgi:hypothetical protein
MTTPFSTGDRVAFNCHILGPVKGIITGFARDVSNGQQHAVVELAQPYPPGCFCKEPVINLKAA